MVNMFILIRTKTVLIISSTSSSVAVRSNLHISFYLEPIISTWRERLYSNNRLRQEEFEIDALEVTREKINYKDIRPQKVIFCDGISSTQNPYFRQLPFAPNKGETLLVEIEGLPVQSIFKKGMMLTPTAEENIYWIGSSYEWKYDNAYPTTSFRQKTEALLKQWLKLPFRIIDHRAGVRPATLERRPFVGMHPYYPGIGILNGMGAKGCSLAPFFAKQLVNHLVHGHSVMPEAEVGRFSKFSTRLRKVVSRWSRVVSLICKP